MAKMLIVSEIREKGGTIRGVYTQKKILWEVIFKDIVEDENSSLMVKLDSEKTSDLNYSKLCKYLKERGMLRIYMEDYDEDTGDQILKPAYSIWVVEPNIFYNPPFAYEDEDKDEDEDEDKDEDPVDGTSGKRERFHI